MSGALFLAIFLACAVEAVEATTLVMAAGMTRGWRSATYGTAMAIGLLAAIVGLLAPILARLPLAPVRLVMGGAMLYYGITWLRKAILRAAGRKPLHDEVAIYAREAKRIDRSGFNLAFNGVLTEGLEVVIIVVGLGGGSRSFLTGAVAALAAVIVVTAAAFLVRKPLARVPENQLKALVGVMLVAFGVFWLFEGLGFALPGSDLSLLFLVGIVWAVSRGAIWMLKRRTSTLAINMEMDGAVG